MTATIVQASIDIVDEKTLPVELEVPNAMTVAAMEAADRGEGLETVENLAELWNQLAEKDDACERLNIRPHSAKNSKN